MSYSGPKGPLGVPGASTIYLAGPMSGYDHLNHPMFDRVAAALRRQGWTVTSPAEIDRQIGIDANADNPYSTMTVAPGEIMRNDLRAVLDCDAIAMLPGWVDSTGARLERVVAESTGRQVFVVLFDAQQEPFLRPAGPWHHELIWRMKATTAQ